MQDPKKQKYQDSGQNQVKKMSYFCPMICFLIY